MIKSERVEKFPAFAMARNERAPVKVSPAVIPTTEPLERLGGK
jgi:hypothetical protein